MARIDGGIAGVGFLDGRYININGTSTTTGLISFALGLSSSDDITITSTGQLICQAAANHLILSTVSTGTCTMSAQSTGVGVVVTLPAVTGTLMSLAGIQTVTGAKTFNTSNVTITDVNVVLSATTGTKFGTATTQKLAFFNSTPVVQEAGTNDVLASLVTLGLRAASINPPLNMGIGNFSTGSIVASGTTVVMADVKVGAAGKGFWVKEGANAKMGTGTLAGGTSTVSTTAVTGSSRIFLTDTGGGLAGNIGALYVSGITSGNGFVVNSANALDSSNFIWIVFDPT